MYFQWVTETNTSPSKDPMDLEKMRATDEAMGNDFTDTLFSSLSQQPFHFPNPREIGMHILLVGVEFALL